VPNQGRPCWRRAHLTRTYRRQSPRRRQVRRVVGAPARNVATSKRVIREYAVVKTYRAGKNSASGAATLLLFVASGCANGKTGSKQAVALPAIERAATGSTGAASAPDTTGTAKDSSDSRGAVTRFGITSPCVLHAGDSQADRRERVTPSGHAQTVVTSGTCSFNAEGVREQGRDFAGDGDVDLDCHDRSCSCSLRRWSPSDKTMSFSFQIDEICSTADMAERLLRDRCMFGLKVAGTERATSGRRDQ